MLRNETRKKEQAYYTDDQKTYPSKFCFNPTAQVGDSDVRFENFIARILGGSTKKIKFGIESTTIFVYLKEDVVIVKVFPPITSRITTQGLKKYYRQEIAIYMIRRML